MRLHNILITLHVMECEGGNIIYLYGYSREVYAWRDYALVVVRVHAHAVCLQVESVLAVLHLNSKVHVHVNVNRVCLQVASEPAVLHLNSKVHVHVYVNRVCLQPKASVLHLNSKVILHVYVHRVCLQAESVSTSSKYMYMLTYTESASGRKRTGSTSPKQQFLQYYT